MKALTREIAYLKAIATGDTSKLPKKVKNDKEYYLRKIAEKPSGSVSEEVISRMVQDNLGENVVTQDEKRGYPDYAETERQNVLTQLKQYYNVENPIVIGFSTDQHLQDIQPEVEENVIPNLRTMRDLTKEFPFDLCVLGGDASSTDTSVPLLNADVLNVSNALDGANCPIIHLVGNHDGRGNIPTIKASAVFGAHRTNALKDNVAIATDESTNCYYDDKAKKIRFIFIISTDLNGYQATKSKTFLLNALENMPNDYEAIIFSHHPMGNLTDDPSTRFDDWNEPLGWGDDLVPYKDKIIACISGHVHDDRHEIKDDILYLSTTCSGFRELNDGTTRTDKLGTVNCTAYDVFVIDRATYTIHCIRYGIGSNRDIVYHIPTYTNVIRTAQDENGEVYNETGYKTGVRLGGSGEEVTGNGTITGFIPVNNGDVVRLKNCNLNGTTNVYTDRLAFYKADHTTLNCQYPYRYIDSSSNLDLILDDDGNVKQFTINSSAIKYVRFSSSTMDENSVVTINEEIN